MNFYETALGQIGSLKKICLNDFSKSEEDLYSSAEVIFKKGGLLYRVRDTRLLLCAHSDEFRTTPNDILWYEFVGKQTNITGIKRISDERAKDLIDQIDEEIFEEISFYIEASRPEEKGCEALTC